MITVTLTGKAYGQLVTALRLKLAELREEAHDCDRVGLPRIGDFYRDRAKQLDEALKEFDGRVVNPSPEPVTRYVYVSEDGKTLSWDDLSGIEDIPF